MLWCKVWNLKRFWSHFSKKVWQIRRSCAGYSSKSIQSSEELQHLHYAVRRTTSERWKNKISDSRIMGLPGSHVIRRNICPHTRCMWSRAVQRQQNGKHKTWRNSGIEDERNFSSRTFVCLYVRGRSLQSHSWQMTLTVQILFFLHFDVFVRIIFCCRVIAVCC